MVRFLWFMSNTPTVNTTCLRSAKRLPTEQLGSFAHQLCAAWQQIAGRAHLGWMDIGNGNHTAPEQDRDFLEIDAIVFGFAAVNGFHVEGMPQDELDAVLGGQPERKMPSTATTKSWR